MLKLYILLGILDWTTSQVANVISFIGVIATIWTLIYAIRQGIKNSKKINDLAEISKGLIAQNQLISEQNLLQATMMRNQVSPDLDFHYNYKVMLNPLLYSSAYQYYIINHGEAATLTEMKVDDKQVIFNYLLPEVILRKGEVYNIHVKTRDGFDAGSCEWSFVLSYTDYYNNKYEMICNGFGPVISKPTIRKL